MTATEVGPDREPSRSLCSRSSPSEERFQGVSDQSALSRRGGELLDEGGLLFGGLGTASSF